jgi:hypothetical protein
MLGLVGLLLIGAIGMLADLAGSSSVRTARQRLTRSIARATLAGLTWFRHDDITRPRSA